MLQVKDKHYSYLNFVDYPDLDNWSSYFALTKKVYYNDKYPLVKISSFLKRNKTPIKVLDDVQYKRATIQMNAKGIKLRDEVLGSQIGTKKQFRIKEGQFLLSKIDARNGAFGVVPADLNDGIITGNFWTFDVNYSIINPFYLSILTGTQQFQNLCQTASVGTTNRNYLQETIFLNFEIPLPSLLAQNELVEDYRSKLFEVDKYLSEVVAIEEKRKSYLNDIFGIKNNIIKKRQAFSFIEYKDLNKWGVSFANYESKWLIVPKFKLMKIGFLCKVGSGGTPDKSKPNYFNGDIPWVKTNEVINEIIEKAEEYLSEDGLKNSSAKIYPPGSLIIAMYGQGLTRGRTAKLGIYAATNQACAVLHDINNEIILTDFLWVYLMNEYDRLREMASGNNQPNLNAGMIFDYEIQVPPKDIQEEVIQKVKLYEAEISRLRIDAENSKIGSINEFAKLVFN
jgi:type I restriction enzyme S subunit